MIYSIEPFFDVLFDVTNVDDYEKHLKLHQTSYKDISFFKTQLYASEIVNVYKNHENITVIEVENNNSIEKIRVLEDIEEINSILNKIDKIHQDTEFNNFLIETFKKM
jgi:hypothetical protein